MLVNISEKILFDRLLYNVYNTNASSLPKDTNGYYNITRLVTGIIDEKADYNKIQAKKQLVDLLNNIDNTSLNEIKQRLLSIIDLL